MFETTTILPGLEIEPKVQSLGIYTVDSGTVGDFGRISKLVNCEHWLDKELAPSRFLNIGNWPAGVKDNVELLAVCFGKTIPNPNVLSEKVQLFISEHVDLDLASFPHLATQLDEEKIKWLCQQGIAWLVVVDEASIRCDSSGNFCNPIVFSNYKHHGLSAHRVENLIDEDSYILFYRK